jgi:hypothetical protein
MNLNPSGWFIAIAFTLQDNNDLEVVAAMVSYVS